jgi:predicted RNase H-like HicB family nuclease
MLPLTYVTLFTERQKMEKKINIHIERLPEGYYLATSDTIQGLVAQGRTITETLEIARDVAKKLLEAQGGEKTIDQLGAFSDSFDYPLVIGL